MWYDVLPGFGGVGLDLQVCMRPQADLGIGLAVFQ